MLHFYKKISADFLLEDNFFPTRTILMFLGALEKGDQGLSITSKNFEIGSLSLRTTHSKLGA